MRILDLWLAGLALVSVALSAAALPPATASSAPPMTALPSISAASSRLADLVEEELRYPEDSSIDSRVLACRVPSADLARLHASGDLEMALRREFFRRDIRLLLVDDAVVSDGASIETATAQLWFLGDEGHGEIRIAGEKPRFETVSVVFRSRAWVESFGEYQKAESRRNRLAVRGDSAIEVDSEAAVVGASREAAALLRQEAVQWAVESGRVRESQRASLEDRLAALWPDGIIVRKFLSDKYVEEDRKPYGELYRASVLMTATGSDLSQIVASAQRALTGERWSIAFKIGAMVLLAPLLILLYMKLDGATRGYFSGLFKVAFVLGFGGISWALLQMSL